MKSTRVARDPPPTKITSAAQDFRRDYGGLFAAGHAVHEVTRTMRPVVKKLLKTALDKPATAKAERLHALCDMAVFCKEWLQTVEMINEEKRLMELEREQKKKMKEFEHQKHMLKRIAAVKNETQYIEDPAGNLIAVEPDKSMIENDSELRTCVRVRAWRAALSAKGPVEPMHWAASPTGCGGVRA